MSTTVLSRTLLGRGLQRGLSVVAAWLAVTLCIAATPPTVTVGDPGNAPDPITGLGAVATEFNIGTREITNDEYTAFLNAVAKTDTFGLFNSAMSITRSGTAGNYSYTTAAGGKPVTYVSWYDAARFTNWLANGQPTGVQNNATTEDGAYTFTGPTTVGARKPGARAFLPSESEWYKAAYYKGGGVAAGYTLYATRSDATPAAAPPPATTQSANYLATVGTLTNAGAYTTATSAYGTYDQAGNAWEWVETAIGSERGLRGGSYEDYELLLQAPYRDAQPPSSELATIGFRIAQAGAGLPPPPPPVNHAPVAVADAYSVNGNAVLTVAAPGLLANDTDADNNALTAIKVADPAHGTLALQANGGFTYTPTTGYAGADSFTYKANDSAADSATVTVALTVASRPVPAISSLSPSTVTAGGATFTLTVNGSDFVNGSTVQWNGVARTTQYVSATRLTATIAAADIATDGSANVTVTTPAPGGGTSAAIALVITKAPVVVSPVVVTASVRQTRSGYYVSVTVANTSKVDIAGVKLNSATLGGTKTSTRLPASLSTIRAQSSRSKTLSFPTSIGKQGNEQELVITGSYSGGTFSETIKLKIGGDTSETVSPPTPDTVTIAVTASARRSRSGYYVSVKVANNGTGNISQAQIDKATLGGTKTSTRLPASLSTIRARSSRSKTLSFAVDEHHDGEQELVISGSYSGGTFSETIKVKLP